jgi:hypothetical protein
VAIYKLIVNGSFGPDEIEVMKSAYEAALIEVGVTDREDPITELIAKSIVIVTATGDPRRLMERALNALGVRRSAALACRAVATGGRDMDPVARGRCVRSAPLDLSVRK